MGSEDIGCCYEDGDNCSSENINHQQHDLEFYHDSSSKQRYNAECEEDDEGVNDAADCCSNNESDDNSANLEPQPVVGCYGSADATEAYESYED